ncbi:MAG TPA: DNA starvation/stationary phase protection protein [Porphyromonadaceae bacterium]|jgi:starvation-inducible DNA-binding protein|uniref:Dps family protein n=1 Tax=Limibacterium fermenti TaxID=3229863 RepID=UPI000E8526C8|nr:DNA starvation/stationary phase protection protein [Porphyromonadaceae bacterium]HBK31239.1 DNA starvation/stationary phase protection protein [Porphyromonadaceae bacterium]HBL33954.1 DNA starvation/stationary phase protection protein [Porphyromonadaceae bacterium]HBX18873.1 DNA starvation/stationary phase protection protein [Porphyromonadaceae bacterium]HBX44380.1 DNA starvation/stationary phase protection protein [Porphyromonadaceae bacterium]
MKTTDYLGLPVKNATAVVKELQQLLADYQLYYTNLRGFHWNIKGKQFYTLHAKFEEFYDNAAEKVDEIAERILMLGGVPAHNFSDYLKVSKIKETGVVSDPNEIVQLLLDYLKGLIAQERKTIETASEGGDEATADLLTGFLGEQEKTVWMLTAYLS